MQDDNQLQTIVNLLNAIGGTQTEFLPEYECKNLDEAEKFYAYFYPHETTWQEMRQFSPELWCKMMRYELALKLNNRI